MANLTEQVAQETWELMFRILGISSGVVKDALAAGGEVTELTKQAIDKLRDYIHERNYERNLINSINEDGTLALDTFMKKVDKEKAKLMSMFVADEDVSIMKEHFKNAGITYVALDVGHDDSELFLFLDNETHIAEKAVMLAQAERGLLSDINPDVFFNSMNIDNIGTISGLNNVELELFRFHAKQRGLLFTSVAENGANTIIFDLSTADKAKQTATDVLWSSVGEEGSLIRKQLEYKISNRQAVNLAFLDAEREYYIINGNNPENFIHITANDFGYYKQSKKVYDVARTSPNFMDRAIQAANTFDDAVLLHKDEFEGVDSEKLKARIEAAKLVAMDRVALEKAMKSVNEKRMLIEDKMALDDEGQSPFWLFDGSISYSEGSTNETFNDLDDEQRKTVSELQDSSKRFVFTEYPQDDKNLDFLISTAEKQRNRGYRYANEKEQEHIV